VYLKRNRPKRQPLLVMLGDEKWSQAVDWSSFEFWLKLPQHLTIANLLPANVYAPDWDDEQSIEQFLDEKFPREEFADFRRALDSPNLMQIGAPKQGVEIGHATCSTKLANYRYSIEIRRYWRAAARIHALIAEREGEKRKRRPPVLRICVWCQALFIACRNNTKWCSKNCGSAARMLRKRAKAKEYELKRELNIDKKNDEQRKVRGGASR
jgi:hypothetical protein